MLLSAIKFIVSELRMWVIVISRFLFSLLGVSRKNLFIAWLFVELNLVVFLGTLTIRWNLLQRKRMLYLIIQRIASGVFLWALLLFNSNNVGQLFMFISLIIKLGGAPFHFWFLKLVQSLRWLEIFVVSTVQKVLPLFIVRAIRFRGIVGLLRAFVAFYSGLIAKELKLVLGYSSLFGLGWILRGLNFEIIFFFLAIYSLGFYVVVTSLSANSQRIIAVNILRSGKAYLVLIGLLSIRGIPPFFGFWGKVARVVYISVFSVFIPRTLVILSAGLAFIYFRTIFIYFFRVSGVALLYRRSSVAVGASLVLLRIFFLI